MKRFRLFLAVLVLFAFFQILEGANQDSPGEKFFQRALELNRDSRTSEAIDQYEKAIQNDPKILERGDDGLAMLLLQHRHKMVLENPNSPPLLLRFDALKQAVIQARQESIRKEDGLRRMASHPMIQNGAIRNINRYKWEINTIMSTMTTQPPFVSPSPQLRMIIPQAPPAYMGPDNRDPDREAADRELKQLYSQLTALQRKQSHAQANFYDAFRRDNRSRGHGRPGIGPGSQVPYHIRDETRQSQAEVFEIRNQMRDVQNRIKSLEGRNRR